MSGHDHEKCMKHFEKISEFLDGELDDAACEKIRSHMESCPDCQVCWSTFKKSVMLFQNIEPDAVPPSFLKELKDFIRSQSN